MARGSDASASARRLMMRLELFGRQGEPRFSLHDPNADDIFEDFHGMDEDLEDDDEDDDISNPFEAVLSSGSFMIRDGEPRFDRHIADALQAAGVPDGAFAINDVQIGRRGVLGLQNSAIEALPRRSPRLQLRRQDGTEAEPTSLALLAQENAGDFDPCWLRKTNTTSLTSSQAGSGRPHPPTDFYTDIYGEGMNHVHLLTKGERIVRANIHVPITTKVYGFRFAIDKFVSTGTASFIIGVAPSPSSFHISDGSIGIGPFWGIDDRGNIIESRLDFIQSIISRSDQNIILSSSDGNSLMGRRLGTLRNLTSNREEIARPASDQLPTIQSIDARNTEAKSSDSTITIIIDNNSRLITFMKGEVTIGATTKLFPISSPLYPVILSYETGSIIAISGMKSDPAGMIIEFKENILRKKDQRLHERRHEILKRRSKLIHAGQPTPELEEVMRSIFLWYVQDEHPRDSDADSLGRLSSARLWYRSGLKLSLLNDLLEAHRKMATDSAHMSRITFADFFSCVCSVISAENQTDDCESFEVSSITFPLLMENAIPLRKYV